MRRLKLAAIVVAALLIVAYAAGLGVYVVASTRPQVPSQPANADEARAIIERLGLADEYPFESRFVATPHGRMHYVDEGRGDPVLCLHGNPTWSFLYRNFVKGLASDHRVIAPDLIGFGLSEKLPDPDAYSIPGHVEDVNALVEALDLDRITLVMQDWGGPIGLGVAIRHPERIRALVVMNTIGFVPGSLENGGGPPLPLRVLRVPVVGEELVQGLGLFNRLFVPVGIARPERKPALVRRAYVDVQGNWDARAGTLAFPRLIPTDREDPVVALLEQEDRFLRDFDGPVLIAWGMKDPAFGSALLEEWRQRFPRADVLELAQDSHFVQEDAHEQIVPRIAELLVRRDAPQP
jgi:haloalkane dehalogenase